MGLAALRRIVVDSRLVEVSQADKHYRRGLDVLA